MQLYIPNDCTFVNTCFSKLTCCKVLETPPPGSLAEIFRQTKRQMIYVHSKEYTKQYLIFKK